MFTCQLSRPALKVFKFFASTTVIESRFYELDVLFRQIEVYDQIKM